MNPAAYLVGRRVYRGASNTPTRGPVDPMGYIERSLASPVGRDGLSDRRTGLAQAALSRLRSSRGGHSGYGHMPMPGANILGNQGMNPVMGSPRNPIDFSGANPMMSSGAAQNFTPEPVSRGYTVSPTGQLLPEHPNPYDATMAAMNGTPEAPNEAQLLQAARDRLQHHFTTKEMLTKHQVAMHKLAFDKANHINRHRMAVSGRA